MGECVDPECLEAGHNFFPVCELVFLLASFYQQKINLIFEFCFKVAGPIRLYNLFCADGKCGFTYNSCFAGGKCTVVVLFL